GDGLGGAQVVTRGEQRSRAGEDHHAHLVVGLRLLEGFAQFNQKPPVLGVAGVDPVQCDADDPTVVEGLVVDEVPGHVAPPTRSPLLFVSEALEGPETREEAVNWRRAPSPPPPSSWAEAHPPPPSGRW